LFDLDANGQITPRELKHVLGNKNKELPDEDWEKLIEEFDKDGDGMINFDEFKRMMLSLHNPNISHMLDDQLAKPPLNGASTEIKPEPPIL